MESHKSKKLNHNHGIIGTCFFCCCCLCHFAPAGAVSPTFKTSYSQEDLLYNDLAKKFPGEILETSHLQQIIDTAFRKLWCGHPEDNKTATCRDNQCLRATDVLMHAGFLPGTDVLTPKSLGSVSVPVISYAANLKTFCSESLSNKTIPCQGTNRNNSLSCWVGTLLPDGTKISQQQLSDLIDNLRLDKRSPQPGKPNNKKTFIQAIYDFLLIPQKADIQRHHIPLLTTFILSQIIKESSEEDLHLDPTPDSFIHSLFDVVDSGYFLSSEKLQQIAAKLKIGNLTYDDLEHSHNEHDHGNYVEHDPRNGNKMKRRAVSDGKSGNNSINNCLSLEFLKRTYAMDKNRLDQKEFERLCPALIQQAFSGACNGIKLETETELQRPPDSHIYGYGTLSVVVISLISVLGIVFFPLLKRQIYEYALQGFIALGVGTLSGDALLHLIPQGFGIHGHDHGKGHETADHSILWRALSCLAAIYGFFLWEICLHSFIHHRNRQGKKDTRGHQHSDHDHDHSHIPDPAAFLQTHTKPEDAVVDSLADVEMSSNARIAKETPKNHKKDTLFGLSPLAWMILLGDSIHNFGDGLTISAAFSQDVNTGISTSIAIFCHEVPHELGDFAILLGTGMSFKKAMILNFVTALACLIGFYIGVPIAKEESARHWIFIIAAGMFLYVALADMLPELKNGKKNFSTLMVQNIGMLTGIGAMVLMGLYEDSIKI